MSVSNISSSVCLLMAGMQIPFILEGSLMNFATFCFAVGIAIFCYKAQV